MMIIESIDDVGVGSEHDPYGEDLTNDNED